MAFIPFGYYKSPAVAWSPADLPDLFDYWEADTGVTGTTNVSQWSGVENSNNFVYTSTSTGPNLVSSDSGFNNQSTLNFDRASSEGLMLSLDLDDGDTLVGTSNSMNMAVYMDPAALASGGWRIWFGMSRNSDGSNMQELLMGSNNSAIKTYNFPSSQTVTLAGTSTAKGIYILSLDYAENDYYAYVDSTTADTAANPKSIGSTNTNEQLFFFGAYNPESGGELASDIVLGACAIWGGDIRQDDIDNLLTYWENKYGA